MAGQIVSTPVNEAADWTDFIDQVNAMKLGFNTIVLSNMDTTTEPKIQAGSWVEVKGTIYKFTAEESITGWAGISNNTDCYIKIVPSGATATAAFTETAPTYTPSSGGYYISDDRYIGGLHRGANDTLYESKRYYGKPFDEFDSCTATADGDVDMDGDVDIGGDLDVTGDVTGVLGNFSGAVSGTTGTFTGAVSGTTGTFSSTLTIGSTTQLDPTPSYATTGSIAAGVSWTPSRGIYMWAYEGAGDPRVEIKNTSTTWYGALQAAGGCLIADGSTVRIRNADASSAITIYYRKF